MAHDLLRAVAKVQAQLQAARVELAAATQRATSPADDAQSNCEAAADAADYIQQAIRCIKDIK